MAANRTTAGRMRMAEVLSGCAVRAAIQAEKNGPGNDAHYLRAIKLRLETLYLHTKEPNILEQISDEVDWLDAKLAVAD